MTEFARYPSLEGKSVIVTGGASGIGAATVAAFAEQGAKVGFLDRDAESAAALKDSTGGAVVSIKVPNPITASTRSSIHFIEKPQKKPPGGGADTSEFTW